MRETLGAAAGLPIDDVLLIGVHCSNDILEVNYIHIAPTDLVNSGNVSAPPPARRLALAEAVAPRGRRLTLATADGSNLIVDAQITSIPADPAQLGDSVTGLPPLESLSSVLNVLNRIAALSGNISQAYEAAAFFSGVDASLNTTAINALLGQLASTWANASGFVSTGSGVGVVSVASGPTVTSPPSSVARDLRYIAGVVIGGMILWGAVTCCWLAGAARRRRKQKKEETPPPPGAAP